ncbi:MAG: kelch repeat-containing protein [Bacteroidia bacterium]|nr:kelch repeat-containing protein [Bacteroidia bacterium]
MKYYLHFFLFLFLLSHLNFSYAQSGVWEEEIALSGSPNPRHEAGFVEVNAKFYLLGGRGIKAVNIYDPVTKSWTNGQAPPIELHHFQPIAYQGKIYGIGAMTGGYPTETAIPNIIIYDPVADQWSTGPKIPAARRRGGAGLVLHNDKFYLVCGIINGHTDGHVNWMDVYDPATDSWQVLSDAPRARDHFQASVIDGKIYALGGRRSTASGNVFANTIAEVDVYDIASNSWTTLNQSLPTLRAGSYNAVLDKEILILGGESPDQNPAHSEVQALDTRTGNWRSIANMLQGRHGTGAVWFQDTLFTASGSGNRGGGPELATQEKLYFEQHSTSLFPPTIVNPFKVKPNPSRDKGIYIVYDGPLRNLDVSLYSLSGKLIVQKTGVNDFPLEWDISDSSLPPGLFVLKIGKGPRSFSQKIFLEK